MTKQEQIDECWEVAYMTYWYPIDMYGSDEDCWLARDDESRWLEFKAQQEQEYAIQA